MTYHLNAKRCCWGFKLFFHIILLDWRSAMLAQKDACVLCERSLSNNPPKNEEHPAKAVLPLFTKLKSLLWHLAHLFSTHLQLETHCHLLCAPSVWSWSSWPSSSGCRLGSPCQLCPVHPKPSWQRGRTFWLLKLNRAGWSHSALLPDTRGSEQIWWLAVTHIHLQIMLINRIQTVSEDNPWQSKFRFKHEILLLDEKHTCFVDVQSKAEVLTRPATGIFQLYKAQNILVHLCPLHLVCPFCVCAS